MKLLRSWGNSPQRYVADIIGQLGNVALCYAMHGLCCSSARVILAS